MTNKTASVVRPSLPKATIQETLAVLAEVAIPNIAKGVIIRRPAIVAMAEKLQLDKRAVRRVQKLRDKYGPGPLFLDIPMRPQALILSPEHVHRVLDESPEPFATATREKRAALAHFEPKMALVSHGYEREDRRRFNEEVLEEGRTMHSLVEKFAALVEEEVAVLLGHVRYAGELDWDAFATTWFRIVRRIVLGDSARDDEEFTEILNDLRANANWSYLRPKNKKLREEFHARLARYLDRAEPGSLASMVAATLTTEVTEPNHQVPQWLFAFDPAGMTTFRTLALLASHPDHAERVREEFQGRSGMERYDLPLLRACVLESLRLWPTTPLVLRQTTRETSWEGGTLPKDTNILIFAPFFHRDDQRLDFADRFTPDLWMRERTNNDWPLIPFSGGHGICPGRNLVLLVTSAFISRLIEGRQIGLKPADKLKADEPLPATLNNYGLTFTLTP